MHPELLLLIGISLSLGFTPGPNNAVAAYSGFNFGIRKTLPLILGVGFGYTALIILINFVLISTFKKLSNHSGNHQSSWNNFFNLSSL